MKILSSGEKIKNIRKHFKLSQNNLSKDLLSISMLSYIESGKCPLKEELAIKLIKRLNEYSTKQIDYRKICIKKEEQYKIIIESILKNIKNIKAIHIKNLIDKLSQDDFPKLDYKIKSIFSSLLSNKYYDYLTSQNYLEEIIDINCKEYDYFYPINILQLQRIYMYSEDYGKLNLLYKKNINRIYKIKKSKLKGYIHYNFGLSLEKNDAIEKSILEYQNALDCFQNKKLEKLALNNIGVCYTRIKEYEKSNKVYIDLLKESNDNIEKSRYYSNLIINFIGLNHYASVRNTANKLENILCILDKNNKIKYQSHMCLGKGYLFLEDRYKAMGAFEKEINKGIGDRKNHFYFDNYKYCIIELTKLYHEGDIDKFRILEKYIDKIPFEILDISFLMNIYAKYAIVYSKEENIQFNNRIKRKERKS